MPNRVIKESIWSSPNFNTLSADAERHFYRVLMTTDDFGCFEATPAVIKGKCYPLMNSINEKDILRWYDELEKATLLRLWNNNGRLFGIFPTFQKHQRVRATHLRKTPPPPENILKEIKTDDITCRQMPSDDRLNHNHNHNPLKDMHDSDESLLPSSSEEKTKTPSQKTSSPSSPSKRNNGKTDSRVRPIIDFFSDAVFTEKGFKPSIDAADAKVIKNALKGMTEEEIRNAIKFYIGSPKAKEHGPTLSIALSKHSLNLFKENWQKVKWQYEG